MFTCIATLSAYRSRLVPTCLVWLVLLTTTIGHARPTPLRQTTTPTAVTAVDPTKCYRLVARANGKVLSLLGGNDGAPLATYAEGAQTGQRWQFVPDGAYYNLQSQTTTKGVQVVNASTAENALLENWTYWGGSHQQWTLQRNAEGYFTLINRNSGKAMTVLTAISGAEARVGQQTLSAAQQQQWSIEEYACSGAGTPNRPPVVVATSTSLTGTSPLSVTFTGSGSSDPDGDPITYLWDFGDGTSSTQPNPVKTFSQRVGAQGVGLILNYTVRLTVTDNKGLSNSQTLQVWLNNNAPTVKITSPLPTFTYALDKETNLSVTADLTDELPDNLAREYKTILRRDNRTIWSVASGVGTTVLPVGCNGESYYYLLTLKVTDKGGLSAMDSVKIYPKCDGPTRLAVSGLTATTVSTSSVRLNWIKPDAPYDDVLVVGKVGAYVEALPSSNTNVADPSFTGNGAALDGGKILYQGMSTSVVITDLPAGQNYFFRVFSRKGSVWGTGMPVNTTLTPNRPPVVVATATSLTGTSPLSATFNTTGTYDPDGDLLFYEWVNTYDFSVLSREANPVLTLRALTPTKGTTPVTAYGIRLTVRDGRGLAGGAYFEVKLTVPPIVKINTPYTNSTYPLDQAQVIPLDAAVTAASSYTSTWQVTLRTANRDFPQLPITGVGNFRPNVTLEPAGCNGEPYYYYVTLKVTDASGLSAKDSSVVSPVSDCSLANVNVSGLTTTTLANGSVRLNWTKGVVIRSQRYDVLVVGRAGGSFTDRPASASYVTNSSFTGNGAAYDGGKALYQGLDSSMVITNLTPGQRYFFRVYTRVPNAITDKAWSGGIETSITIPGATTTAPPTSATAIDITKCYRIQSRSSGLALTVPAGAGTDGTALQQRTNTGQLWQKWRFALDGAYYRIAAGHNLKAVQVANASTADNAPLEQWTYWGGGHQQWTANRNADGFFTLSNRNSGKAMTVQGASTADGAGIVQQTLGMGTNQQWSLVETACSVGARVASAEPGVGTSFSLYPNPANDHVLIDLSRAQGQPVGLTVHNLLGVSIQQMYLEAAPAAPYRFRTGQLADGLYLMQVTLTGQAPTTLRLLIQH
ncbi:RICIN domain-containing protein [Fibrella sp. HMF5335]|uniref:RICIN domain-containing protein n=1 Tax=Fibrella rubiginis TaxID=2817060 RepID=A0A939GIP9_9BACT|nr:RICIN domain-containing protein [Fibrella rubiginis]MBO0937476.1 RICIN domain-containing protein [Fibrella rubiginis]